MENNLAYHVQMFNDRVRAMNQTHKTELRLTAVDANNLLSDIFAVLAQNTSLVQQLEQAGNASVEVVMDGGGFK
jgi:(p)ppGpp synthase/HD superfamily hydrolase